MNLENSIALVTGANRGIGKAFVGELFNRGAEKVYAGVRSLGKADELVANYGDKIVPIQIEVTNDVEIEAAAKVATDINLLINNAGYLSFSGEDLTKNLDEMRKEFEINVYGPIKLTGAFQDSIIAKQGAILNINSIASLFNFYSAATYSASKAAAHSITQGLRVGLGSKGVHVMGVYPGPIDTDMADSIEMEKASAESVAVAVFDALERGEEDVFPDAMAQAWHEAWKNDAKAFETEMASMATAG